MEAKNLIKQGDKTYIKGKCWLVPTDKSSIYLHNGKLYNHKISMNIPDGKQIPQDLIITTAETIQEGDWYLFNVGYASGVKQATKDDIDKIHLEIDPKEIVSSTDKSLNLPQPSQDFINKYIERWNKDEKIVNILIECEDYWIKVAHSLDVAWKIKTDSHNKITIKAVKESWNKKELLSILKSISPKSEPLLELPDFNANWDDTQKVEWGMRKAYLHDSEVIKRYIKENL